MTLREQLTAINLLRRCDALLKGAKSIPNGDCLAVLAEFDQLRADVGEFLQPRQCSCTHNGDEPIRCGASAEPGKTLCAACIGGHQWRRAAE